MRGTATLQWSGSASARCLRSLGWTCEGGYCKTGNLWRCGTGDTNQESLCCHYIEHWWKKLLNIFFLNLLCMIGAVLLSGHAFVLLCRWWFWLGPLEVKLHQSIKFILATSSNGAGQHLVALMLEVRIWNQFWRDMEVRVLWWYETFFPVWCSGNDILQVWITRFLLQSTGASSTSMIWKGKSFRRQICQSHVHWKKHTPAWHGWTSIKTCAAVCTTIATTEDIVIFCCQIWT